MKKLDAIEYWVVIEQGDVSCVTDEGVIGTTTLENSLVNFSKN